MSPVLEGRFLTTGPPGKPQPPYFFPPRLSSVTITLYFDQWQLFQAASNVSFLKMHHFFDLIF